MISGNRGSILMLPTRVVFAGDLSSLLGFTSSKVGLTTVTNGWTQWPSHCRESPVQSYDCHFPKHLQGVSSGSSWPGTCQQLQRRFSMTGLLFVNSQCWARGRETALGREIVTKKWEYEPGHTMYLIHICTWSVHLHHTQYCFLVSKICFVLLSSHVHYYILWDKHTTELCPI